MASAETNPESQLFMSAHAISNVTVKAGHLPAPAGQRSHHYIEYFLLSPAGWQSTPTATGKAERWLTDADSLTRKLVNHSGGQLRVQRINEGRRFTSPGYLCYGPTSVSGAAGNGFGLYWQREVVLLGRGQPWIRALTLVPCRHQALTRRLRLLKNRPLGNFLFQQPKLQRLGMDFIATGEGHARRSRFRLANQEMILIELFCNDFLDTL